ncbi:MAG: TonB-dependent receptor [Desulfuromonas sp.]|nr:TonB-dependent receptor [Desulfuromonas sp.]
MQQGNTKSRLALTAFIGLPLFFDVGLAQAAANVFNLGNVIVTGTNDDPKTASEHVISSEKLQRFNRDNVGQAVNMLPGVSLREGGTRNEQTVSVRGFDSRQVPVFLDGIPQYVPYDGNVDLARFSTLDLSEIRVAQGAASLLYGSNIMGGAINLVTRKPSKELEGNVRIGIATGSERLVAANVGTNQGLWYLQASLSYLEADNFKLGRGFEDGKATPTDTRHRRDNAYRTDQKGSFKLGFTPNDTDEYALGYTKQEGEKGNPVYAGKNTNESLRYWQWPIWDKESIYFLSSTALDDNNSIKLRAYQDKYENALSMYKDVNYQTLDEHSPYDDKIYGAAIEWVNTSIDQHELHLAIQHKDDRHNDGDKKYRDVTQSIALEDMISLSDTWRLRVGASHEERRSREVYLYDKGTARATNGLLEIIHDLNENVEVFASVAKKTRLPTLKDRYSARLGRALPNPDLEPEVARHTEFGLRGTPWRDAYAEATAFYSGIFDEIQTATTHVLTCGKKGKDACEQAQNIGKTRHRGVELSLEQRLGEDWRLGGAYTYLQRDNLSDSSVKLTDTPTHKLFAHASWLPIERLELQVNLDAETGRKISYSERKGTPDSYPTLSGFAVAGFKSTYMIQDGLSIEAGIRNINNKNYEYSDGYPMPGRTWFAGANYSF